VSKRSALILLLFFLAASSFEVISPANGTADSWVLKAPMPKPEEYVGAAVVNGKVYTFGSTDYATQVYDPGTEFWVTKASMPNPAIGFAVAAYQDKIYVIGGSMSGIVFRSIGANRVYYPATDSWQTKTPLPLNLSYICANVVERKIYVMGGLLNELDPLYRSPVASSKTLIYDPATDKWNEGTSMPTGVYGYASAVVDKKIYIIGGTPTDSNPGFPPRSPLHFNQIYDTETDTWTFGADPPFSGGTAGATTGMMAPKRIYLFGGGGSFVVGGVNPQSISQMYDPQTNIWVDCTEMIGCRFGLAVAVVNDKLHAIGGTAGWEEGQGYVGLATNAVYTPIGYGTTTDRTAPEIRVLSPENKTYSEGYVSLIFSVNKPVAWLGYSFDGKKNTGIFGNITLVYNYTLFDERFPNHNTTIIYGLHNETFPDTIPLYQMKNGLHNITVSAIDTNGNIGVSETVHFSIITNEPKPEAESFPTTLIIAISGALLAVIGTCLLVYSWKHKQ
jgi:N-acetylneuraminic acid mutarotase